MRITSIIIIIIILKVLLNAQDSLYWFDMSKVRDSIPYTPKVLDKVFGTSQLKILDSLKNIQVSTREGFRLQIFESSSADEANRVLKKFNKSFSDSLYMIFEAPLYKIRYGNYITKQQAEDVKKDLRNKGYKNIWVVKSRIDQSMSLQDKNQ
tara:strand:+ start:495 stop:950 length:456 start_codon:yes stop_codon:yes gene_type:complete